MARYQIWNKLDDIITPSGAIFNAPEWEDKYPWVKRVGAKMIISGGPINGGCALEFTQTKEMYALQGCEFGEDMTDEEVLATIELWEDSQQIVNEGHVSPEERIAAALEMQTMLQMPDVSEEGTV